MGSSSITTRSRWRTSAGDAAHAELAARTSLMEEEEGLDSVEVDDIYEYLPGIDPSGVAYALYEPDSGFADPVATTKAYVEAGRRAGGVARDGAPVESIEV